MSTATANRTTVKQAAKTAKEFIEAFYSDLGEPVHDLMIEEVELSDDGAKWQITVGFSRPHVTEGIAIAPPAIWRMHDRVYKIVAMINPSMIIPLLTQLPICSPLIE